MNEIKWTNNNYLLDESFNPGIDSARLILEVAADKIKRYVTAQVKDFLKENHILEKRWFKYGAIERLPEDRSGITYILHYNTLFREIRRKVTIEFNMVV